MSDVHIYQIYYNEETQKKLQKGFIPLDNRANEHPDWAEYWPIRQHYLNNTLNPNDWYGFLSPKFTDKTGLTSEQVYEFVNRFKDSDAEVITFSLHWINTCYYLNVFEHGEEAHPGLQEVTQSFLDRIGMKVSLKDLVMHSQNTVWCNYFVAKPSFWKRWHEIMDALYQEAHNGNQALNERTTYAISASSMKVFIIERLTSLLLAVEPFKTVAYDTFSITSTASLWLLDYAAELMTCNAYKLAYDQGGSEMYLEFFYRMRNTINARLEADKAK